MVVVSWVPEGFRGRQESKSACDSSTDGIRAWHGGAREGRSVQARLFNGVVGQQREESRLQNTVPLLPKKSGALCNPKPAIFGFFLCKLPHLNPSHFLHPPPHNFLTLTTSLSSPTLKISHLIPPRSRLFFPLSLQPLPRSLSRLNLCEVSPLPLLSGTAASSRSDFSHFPPQYAAMYVQKRGKSALPIASPPASNPTQMDARSAYSSTRSQLVFRDCAMGSIWTTSIPWQSLKR